MGLSKEVIHNEKFGEKAHAGHSGHLRRLAEKDYSNKYSYDKEHDKILSVDHNKDHSHSKYYHYDYQGVVPFTQYEENMVDPFTITKHIDLNKVEKARKLYKKADELLKGSKELSKTKQGI